jgi:hypothetical protein
MAENTGENTVPHEHPKDKHKHEVRIHIDQKPYESSNPTTGEALYILGRVPEDQELFREVQGDKEDRPIPNGLETIHLKEDEHFHSGLPSIKEFSIIVNGRQKVVAKRNLSFTEIVALAFDPAPTGPNIMFTITYRHGPHGNAEGTLLEGTTVKVKNGMIFNVTATDKS